TIGRRSGYSTPRRSSARAEASRREPCGLRLTPGLDAARRADLVAGAPRTRFLLLQTLSIGILTRVVSHSRTRSAEPGPVLSLVIVKVSTGASICSDGTVARPTSCARTSGVYCVSIPH